MHESLHNGQARLLEMLVLNEPLEDILASCLRLCEANAPEMLGSIMILDQDGKHLRQGAAPSLPAEYLRLIDGAEIGPRAGSCGTAAYLREPVVVEDIANDPLWAEYRDLALPFGLRACWSTPIFDRQRAVLGTFAIYYRKPCKPTAQHLHLIGLVTHIAGISIYCRVAEERRRRIFERISDGFVALDALWRYVYVNPKAEEFLGREPDSLIGKHIWTEFPESVGQEFHLACEKAMAEQVPVALEDFHPSRGRWFENRIYPSPQGLTIYFHDITDRKQAEEKLRQSEKMSAIGQLAGGVAHDFNNQLSIILGYAGMLQSRLKDPVLKRFASAIVSAADRSGDLTRKLLAFSRQGRFGTDPLRLHDMIGEIVEIFGLGVDKRITIRKEMKADRDVVLGDSAALQNVLLNLALNARDAMPEGGVLGFATDTVRIPDIGALPGKVPAEGEEPRDLAPGEYFHLAVSDTGTGMSDAVRKRIFEPFFTTKPVGKGTGMGLASVFGTVKNHNGLISVDSEIGKGTTFHVCLPLAAGDFQADPMEAAEEPPERELRILVIEDEEPLLQMVGDMLRANGHEVVGALSGREGLERYREGWRDIDLIVLDLVMPDIDGYRTFQELRRINPAARVLLSSGFSPEGKIQAALEEGAMGLLPKPYEKAQLDAMVAAAMA